MSAVDERVPDEQYDWEAVRERLRKEADAGFPTSWQPEEIDEEMFGTLAAVRASAPSIYGPAPVVEIVDPTGTHWSVWLFSTVLRRAFERQRVELGERVLIRYLGKVYPEGGGNAYHNYSLTVDRPAPKGQPDWAGIARRYEDEALDEEPLRQRDHDDREPDFQAEDDIPF